MGGTISFKGDLPAEQPNNMHWLNDRLWNIADDSAAVPLVVVSPYSRAGHVSDHVTDHSSILRFVETRFLLPALTSRDANAWPLLDMFDFTTRSFATPPSLEAAPVDPAHQAECEAIWEPQDAGPGGPDAGP